MRGRKKWLAALFVCVMAAGLLSGCGKVTAQSLLGNYGKKIEKADSWEMKEDIRLGVTVTFMVEADLAADVTLNMKSKDGSTWVRMDSVYDAMGNQETHSSETYVIKGSPDVYTKEDGEWSSSKIWESGTSSFDLKKIAALTEAVSLREEKEERNGVSCYVVDLEVPWKYIVGETMDLGGLMDTVSEYVDVNSLKLDAVLYFDAKTKDLTEIYIDATDTMSDIMDQAMNAEHEDASGEDDDPFALSMKVNEVTVRVYDIGVGGVDDIVLPEEASAAAE